MTDFKLVSGQNISMKMFGLLSVAKLETVRHCTGPQEGQCSQWRDKQSVCEPRVNASIYKNFLSSNLSSIY